MMIKLKEKIFNWANSSGVVVPVIAEFILISIFIYGGYLFVNQFIYILIGYGFFGGIKYIIINPVTWIAVILVNIGSLHNPIKKSLLCRGIPLQISKGVKTTIKVVCTILLILINIIVILASIVLLIDNYQYYGISWGLLYGFDGVFLYALILLFVKEVSVFSYNANKIEEELKDMIAEEQREKEEEERERRKKEREKEMKEEEERRREEFRRQAEAERNMNE
mgnify:CR=1 FL=1